MGEFEQKGLAEVAAQIEWSSGFASGIPNTEFIGEASLVLHSVQTGFKDRLSEDQREKLAAVIEIVEKTLRRMARP